MASLVHEPQIGATSSHSHLLDALSPSQSHFSSISRISSISNLQELEFSLGESRNDTARLDTSKTQAAFKWTELQRISQDLYIYKQPHKASTLLGVSIVGVPTVLAANGLICIGTDKGKICVYDFKQNLKCICGTDVNGALILAKRSIQDLTATIEGTLGAVTAISLSHDQAFVACGYASGQLHIYDLKNPQKPIRVVATATLAAVASGRKEGHIHGSRIIGVGFIGGRHTAIVSADENGLAFYHSLGKVLFVEASDILRILGKYPETTSFPKGTSRQHPRYSLLAMAPLPLGPFPHATDPFNVVALLTSTKLVVVGLKPTPRTWFKCPRDIALKGKLKSNTRERGALSWFPHLPLTQSNDVETLGKSESRTVAAAPRLAYSWGSTLNIIYVHETTFKHTVKNPKTRKFTELNIGTIVNENRGKWISDYDILALQWLNANQIVIVTAVTLGVFDIQAWNLIEQSQFDGRSLASHSVYSRNSDDATVTEDSTFDISHSLRIYKNKMFLLGKGHMQVGTLLTWADHILTYVETGDFLSAIDLARCYYTGEASGNKNGLPVDKVAQKEVIGEKMGELMLASMRYAFSEDRMRDGTHVTPDNRGVDRTSLFERLVSVCCKACIALNDFEFLFEDLFQQYDDAGISGIYLRRLELFILSNEIHYVPPRITQRLISIHEDFGLDHVEHIIWHIDPLCLDINQTIHLCQKHHLYDALIYIYTRALHDYVAPIVELLGLIRDIQRDKSSRQMTLSNGNVQIAVSMEAVVLNAYKIFPYLANVLSGLTYPSEEPLPDSDCVRAKTDVYAFLFFGRSNVWPPGPEGKLILTAEEECGVEPTYPYVRQLLRFDSESFLHSLDIAFEDAYLHEEDQKINRWMIVRVLLDIISSDTFSKKDVTLVNIFIARNIPKYPQFIFLQAPPNILHQILVALAEDPDLKTLEDRQLAAEYLLSVYNPLESERIIQLFEKARFYRILRAWYRQERRWAALLSSFIEDSDYRKNELLERVEEVLSGSRREHNAGLPADVIAVISASLPRLLQANLFQTASLIDFHIPDIHQKTLDSIADDNHRADHDRYSYLRYLVNELRVDEDDYFGPRRRTRPSPHLSEQLRQQFFALQCHHDPDEVIETLASLPDNYIDWSEVLRICEEYELYDATIWVIDHQDKPHDAISKAHSFQKKVSICLVSSLTNECNVHDVITTIRRALKSLEDVGRRGLAICSERSRANVTQFSLEDIWFQLLSSQMNCVQLISEGLEEYKSSTEADEVIAIEGQKTLTALRTLVQDTFGAFVSMTSTRTISFPQFFKKLVSSVSTSTGTQYNEFRAILMGMLESYRSDGDLLVMTKCLVDRDLFDTITLVTRQQVHGWAPSQGICTYCRNPLFDSTKMNAMIQPKPDISYIVVSRTGEIYHTNCLPPST